MNEAHAETTTLDNSTEDAYITTNASTGATCSTGLTGAAKTSATDLVILVPADPTNAGCVRAYAEWPLTTIPDDATITSVVFKFEVTTASNARNCDFMPMELQPSTNTAANVYLDIGNGTAYVSNDSTCTTTGQNKQVTLGSTAASTLQSRLTSGEWFAVGFKFNSEARDASAHQVNFAAEEAAGTPDPALEVTYTLPTVTVPIQINMRSGSDTPETAGVAITVSCPDANGDTQNLSHDGNPSTQNFTCQRDSTVTVTMPSAATSRFLFSDGTTSKTITACSSGTCSTTTYNDVTRQFRQTITVSGFDTGYMTKVTRTQLGTTTVEPYTGTSDYSLKCDGSTEYGQAASNTVHDITTGDLSITGWIYRGSDSGGAETIVHKFTGSTGYFIQVSAGDRLRAGIVVGAANFQPVTDSLLTTNTWYFFTATWDRDANLVIYLNGVQNGTPSNISTASASISNTNTFTVARNSASSDSFFPGYIDDLRFYNKALSSTEVSNIYNGIPVTSGLVSQYLFDDGTGTTATDSIGSNDLTLFNTPTWENKVWADQGSSVDVADTIVITADQERFATYNATAFTASSAQSKTYVFQHEFNQLFRIFEQHQGTLFEPMPGLSLTATVTTANSTAISETFATQVTDDYVQPTTRYWVKNGTQTFGAITWRDLVVRPSGDTCSVTSYGNCDVAVFSKHLGYEGNRHFRLGVDGLTTDIDNITFDASTASIEFNATATGSRDAKVEFLTNVYDDVSQVQVDGATVDSINWGVSKSGNVGILTIQNIAFSEKTITVFFTGTTLGGSGIGGGGGGGVGVPVISPPSPPRTAGALTIDIPNVSVRPGGDSVQFEIFIEWSGSGIVSITGVQFEQHPEWFIINKPLPIRATFDIQPGEVAEQVVKTAIPVTVAVPSGVVGTSETVDVVVTANDGVTVNSVRDDLQLVYTGSADLALVAAFSIGAAVIGAAVVRQVRKR